MICYTIGHSTHTFEKLLNLLNMYKINCIVDVRSSPYSKFAHWFNKENLFFFLKKAGISYFHFKNQFGARKNREDLLTNGRVDFQKVRKTPEFQSGINRIITGLEKGRTICLLCSEKEPLDCHRFILIAYFLEKKEIKVLHILEDGSLKTNTDLEEALIKKFKIEYNQYNLFSPVKTRDEAVEEAYLRQNKEIATKVKKGE